MYVVEASAKCWQFTLLKHCSAQSFIVLYVRGDPGSASTIAHCCNGDPPVSDPDTEIENEISGKFPKHSLKYVSVTLPFGGTKTV